MQKVNHLTKTISNLADSEIVPQNANRVGLVFSPPSAGAYEINLTGASSLGAGIRIPAGSTPFPMYEAFWGEIVKGSVRAIAESAPVTVGITEIVGP